MQRASFDAQRRLTQRLHALASGTEPHAQVLCNQRVAAGLLHRAARSHAHATQRRPRLRATPRHDAPFVEQTHVRLRLRLRMRLRARVQHRKRRHARRRL